MSPDNTTETQQPNSSDQVVFHSERSNTRRATPSRNKWLIGGSIAALLAILAVTAVSGYLWYQNPQRVVSQALFGAVGDDTNTIDGSIAFKGKGGNISKNTDIKLEADMENSAEKSRGSFDITAAGLEGTSQTWDVSFDVASEKNKRYLMKVKGVRDIISSLNDTNETPRQLVKFSDRYENKWIEVDQEDIERQGGAQNEIQKCFDTLSEKIASDENFAKEARDIYAEESAQFVVVKDELGVKNGSVGYVVSIDTDKAVTFADKLETTKLYKEAKDCFATALKADSPYNRPTTAQNFDLSDELKKMFEQAKKNNDNSNTEARFEVWADRWTHDLTSVRLLVEDDEARLDADFDIDLDAEPAIELPARDVEVETLIRELSGDQGDSSVPKTQPTPAGNI